VLAAQFESFIHPFVIILAVPLAVAGAMFGLWVTGATLNIYSQIGIVMLVGLSAKNGILIVEFANQLRDSGRSIREALVESSVTRFRPILMTSLATAMGAVPLMLWEGAGTQSRFAIGIVVFAGVIVSINETAASPELRRFGRLPSITIQASLADNYDLGRALTFMEEQAKEILPAEAKLGFAGQSQQFKETSSGIALTFALALLIVFLVLAAQFESWIHPIIIMLSVPLAIAGALYSMAIGGVSLNIYSQIGIILLVGLMAKNGILIVEFANQLRDEGMSVRQAVVEASVLRLRPILMTVIATILGAVPLVFAHGAGAESRIAIGIVIVGGLGFASILTLFLTPVLYDLLARFTRPRGAVEKFLDAELNKSRPSHPAAMPAPTPAE